ncbi:MAG: TraR/DksA family transcriptional regulator [Alphaproteobacteria bacterium]
MSDHKKIEKQLGDRLRALTERIEQLDEDLRAPADPDFSEQATEAEDDEMMEALEESSRAEVAQIKAALARIKEGTYGTCASCEEPIAKARLDALPYATLCIDCAKAA